MPDLEALAQHALEIAADRVAVRGRRNEHVRGKYRDARRQFPEVEIVHLVHKRSMRHRPAHFVGSRALRRTLE